MSERPDNGRRYTVIQRNADMKPITTVHYKEPKVALEQFERCLHGAHHLPKKVAQHLTTWTLLLMQGAQGYEVLDPGLQGSISITITTDQSVVTGSTSAG
jgi:hypothetical protein